MSCVQNKTPSTTQLSWGVMIYLLNCRLGGLRYFWCSTFSLIMILGCDQNGNVPRVDRCAVGGAALVGVTQQPAPNDILILWFSYDRNSGAPVSFEQALAEAKYTEILDASKFNLDNTARETIKRQCPNLKWLRLRGDPVDKETLDWVTEFVELRGLSLKHSKFGENDLDFLKKLPKLAWLDLRVTGMPSADHFRIDSIPQLEALFLSDPGITDDHLSNLRGLPKLRSLSLDGTSITDEGVAVVANSFPDLRFLSMFHVKGLTSRSVANIASLKELKELQVGLTPLEDQLYDRDYNGLPALQKLLPECFIAFGD